MADKSVEQKLYEAFHAGRGLRLTAWDVESLVTLDDAIQTRICNKAALEGGYCEAEHGGDFNKRMTWKKFIELFKD